MMAKPFDTSLNRIIDTRPHEWASFFAERVGIPPGPAKTLDTDLATSVQADKAFLIEGESPAILHLELESGSRLGIPAELLRYNVLLDSQHQLPVYSVLVLLRPKAVASDQSGIYRRIGTQNETIIDFRYTVIRLWEESFDRFLNVGAALAPLAMLTNEAADNLPQAFDAFQKRLRRPDVPDTMFNILLESTYFLCGLRFKRDLIIDLYRRFTMAIDWEDSTAYQYILELGEERGISKGVAQGVAQGVPLGRIQEAHSLLVRQGVRKFGEPANTLREQFQAILDVDRLERIADRIFDATSWDDLLATQ